MNGNAVCNEFLGSSYNIVNHSLTFDQIGVTRMICADMSVEYRFLQILEQVTSFKTEYDRLIYLDSTGNFLASFEEFTE